MGQQATPAHACSHAGGSLAGWGMDHWAGHTGLTGGSCDRTQAPSRSACLGRHSAAHAHRTPVGNASGLEMGLHLLEASRYRWAHRSRGRQAGPVRRHWALHLEAALPSCRTHDATPKHRPRLTGDFPAPPLHSEHGRRFRAPGTAQAGTGHNPRTWELRRGKERPDSTGGFAGAAAGSSSRSGMPWALKASSASQAQGRWVSGTPRLRADKFGAGCLALETRDQ